MDWKVTVLCENTVPRPGLLGEHGFAAYVETPGSTFLFDTGQGYGLTANALRLRKDLRSVEKLVLSHGHFDHTGGILAFLGVHGPCDILAHPDCLGERFWQIPTGNEAGPLSVGIPWREAHLTTRGARFQWVRDFTEIAPGVFLTGEVPRKTDFEAGNPGFVVRSGEDWVPDPFLDDFSIALTTSKGLVVLLGCAHAGLINILNHLMEKTGENRIHSILGGTHLGFCAESRLDRTIETLKAHEIEMLAVSHCTGQGPAARLAAEFPGKFAFAPVGYTIET